MTETMRILGPHDTRRCRRTETTGFCAIPLPGALLGVDDALPPGMTRLGDLVAGAGAGLVEPQLDTIAARKVRASTLVRCRQLVVNQLARGIGHHRLDRPQ